MARPAFFVRPLVQGEMEFLAHLRKWRRQALRQRADILLASMVYTPVNQIALIFRTDEAYVRKVIHAFNEHGFESLNPTRRAVRLPDLVRMRAGRCVCLRGPRCRIAHD
jgi:hypothetical protein